LDKAKLVAGTFLLPRPSIVEPDKSVGLHLSMVPFTMLPLIYFTLCAPVPIAVIFGITAFPALMTIIVKEKC
jgi:hypothetical protein